MDQRCRYPALSRSSPTTNTWVELIVEIRYEGTTTAAQSVGSSTSTFFHFAFDVSITNAFIMYKNFHSSPSFKTIKEFRLQLAQQLIGDYCSRRRAGRSGGAILSLQLEHFPLKVTMESSPPKRRRGRCAHCSRRDNRRTDSSWYCRECGVWLCHSGDVNSDLWHKYNNQ